ncbi:thioredoxin-disulfide reductase [Acetobacterium sp.]|uniref:thioredoxin-disulfide reductase n=1 Tax=Acetobacterium sp. TaxID=1872094 RepID=UPI002F3FE77C
MTYDLIIIGSGPAGLTAGLYAARGSLKVLIIEKAGIGGQIATAREIENYPGAPANSTGPDLAERMRQQCVEFGVEFSTRTYLSNQETPGGFLVQTDAETLETKTIIIATGKASKSVGYKGEQELRGMGVSYCAVCDANFFKGLRVAVIGGDDAALEDSLYLTKFAKEVVIIHQQDTFKGDEVLQKKVMDCKQIEILDNTQLEEIKGSGMVASICVKDLKTGKICEIPMDGVFIFAGLNPNTEMFVGSLQRNAKGYLVTDAEMRTSIPGLFAAGDVREKSLRQVVTATADGAIAAFNAIKFIDELV